MSLDQKFDHKTIDVKWQKHWNENFTFKTDIDNSKEKYYVLDMFPYPSGSGLHVGHIIGYTCTDIIARMKRVEGFNVLHPMGWDSFGLPAEQFAIKTGRNPADITIENVSNFRRQLKSVGFSYDWDREIATSSESYYKWTQFIFTEMYKHKLAYQEEHFVNYCPALGTVLSKEEVDNGVSKEGKFPVKRIFTKQWVLRITKYADRLLEDLEGLDWPEGIKQQQINWIGKKTGYNVISSIDEKDIKIFIQNPEFLSVAKAVVISPENDIVKESSLKTVQEYISKIDYGKNVNGVKTEFVCINPLTGELLPVWISDYVSRATSQDILFCGQYGTDEEIEFNKYIKAIVGEPSGRDEAIKTLKEKELIHDGVSYKLKDWIFARQRFWGEPVPIIHFKNGSKRALDISELPLTLPSEYINYKNTGCDFKTPLEKNSDWINVVDPVTGSYARRDGNTMPQWAGSCWYYLRFMDPKNDSMLVGKDAESYWKSVDMYIGGAEHAVLHLLYARFWHKFLYDIGIVDSKEPFQSLRNQGLVYANAYIDSSNKYYDPSDVECINGKYISKKDGVSLTVVNEKMSKSKLNGISPDQIIEEYGADALRLYAMFMGPFDQDKKWDTHAMKGCRRLVDRVYRIAFMNICDSESSRALINKTVIEMKSLINEMKFNVAISKAMVLLNNISHKEVDKEGIKNFLAVFSTIAPHVSSEVWNLLKFESEPSLYIVKHVNIPKQKDEVRNISYIIQVNGKFRAKLNSNLEKDEAIKEALSLPSVEKFVNETEIRSVIFIKDKLINFVL